MIRWAVTLFGLGPIKNSLLHDPKASCAHSETGADEMSWPEGLQTRREVRFSEPAGWEHSNWSWHSNGYVSFPNSLYPKDQAEYRKCLGALKCKACGRVVRPRTKTAALHTQLVGSCPGASCDGALQHITCDAQVYRYVAKEDGVNYSIWEHTGSHCSHPRPPLGRKPPRRRTAPNEPRDRPAHPAKQTHNGNLPSGKATAVVHTKAEDMSDRLSICETTAQRAEIIATHQHQTFEGQRGHRELNADLSIGHCDKLPQFRRGKRLRTDRNFYQALETNQQRGQSNSNIAGDCGKLPQLRRSKRLRTTSQFATF